MANPYPIDRDKDSLARGLALLDVLSPKMVDFFETIPPEKNYQVTISATEKAALASLIPASIDLSSAKVIKDKDKDIGITPSPDGSVKIEFSGQALRNAVALVAANDKLKKLDDDELKKQGPATLKGKYVALSEMNTQLYDSLTAPIDDPAKMKAGQAKLDEAKAMMKIAKTAHLVSLDSSLFRDYASLDNASPAQQNVTAQIPSDMQKALDALKNADKQRVSDNTGFSDHSGPVAPSSSALSQNKSGEQKSPFAKISKIGAGV